MCGEQHGHPGLGAQVFDETPDLAAVGQIKPDRRLVEEKNLRMMDDAAHDIQRAPHATRQRSDRAVAFVRKAEQFEQFRGAFFDDLGGKVVEQPGEAQVFRDG